MNLLSFLFLFSSTLAVVNCTPTCEDFASCSACIFSEFGDCQWCAAENHKGKRCQSKALNKPWCNETPIRKPEIESNITENFDWSNGERDGKTIQFKPQRVTIKSASPGIPVTIPLSYKPAKDAPLDVYFLLDNSGNIHQYKSELIAQVKNVFENLENYTNNVRLGVGTFVEKPALPFANPDYDDVYTFKNHISFTSDTLAIHEALNKIISGRNYDIPEDIFDALMQVMLCKEQLNWTPNGHRFIVVLTNAVYHSAGEGKFIGAFKRYDMRCHENDTDVDITMDYPSIGQLKKVVMDNRYVIIFAVHKSVVDVYKELSKEIEGSKFVDFTNITSEHNIAKIISNEYIRIIEKVDITHNSTSDIEVTIEKPCENCTALHNQPLDLNVTLTVVKCPKGRDKEFIKIGPISLNESLIVEIEYNCQCRCEKDNFPELNLKKCNGNGDYQCGICKCKPDRYGDDCRCKSDTVSDQEDYKKCKRNNDTLLCSGRGECSCGKCESCHEGFSGPFCEYSCLRRNNKICSGHGNCEMGKCICDSKWGHSPDGFADCGCTLDEKSCIAPYSNKPCSGNGICKCGLCVCNSAENSNDTCTGRYCNNCKRFDGIRCIELEEFVYCNYMQEANCNEKYNLTNTVVFFANRSEMNSPDAKRANWCRVQTEEDDSIIFKYYSTSETGTDEETSDLTLYIVIQKELDKKPPANIWVAIGSAIGSILLIGVITLILWKVITYFYDAREYNQFVEKARAAGYNVNMTENPWYEPPVTTFRNPAHIDN